MADDLPLKFAKYLNEINQPTWLRYVLVPGYSDDENDLHEWAKFTSQLKNVERVDVLPFHQMGQYKWEKVGNGTPQGGGEIVNVYGGFNHIESSSWNVTFDIENDKIIPNSMALANYLRMGGRIFD